MKTTAISNRHLGSLQKILQIRESYVNPYVSQIMKSSIIESILTWPLGSTILAALFTTKAHLSGNRTRIFYDGCWIHKSGSDFFAERAPLTRRNPSEWMSHESKFWIPFYRPRSGDTVVEIGAGIGIETVLFGREVGEKGLIVSIEAHPTTYSCLLKTCEYNNLKNVKPLNVAVVDNERTVFLEDNPKHIGNALTLDEAGSLNLPGRTMDSIYDQLGLDRVSMLRMNIEGAEQFAIRGMERTIKNTSYAAIACHDFKAERTGNDFFRTKKTVVEWLLDHGFNLLQMQFEEPWAKDHVYAINPRLQ